VSYYTSKPTITLADLQQHRSYTHTCDWPVYRARGAMLTTFTDCSRWPEWRGDDPRVSNSLRRPVYCFQHFKMYERLVRLEDEREEELRRARAAIAKTEERN
jgi:hypothetical protein